MSNWSLAKVLEGLHVDIQKKLEIIRETLNHPVAKGDASERVWIDLLNKYLPQRYRAAKAFVVDSKGIFSQQIDVVIFDRQYSPLIFEYEGETIIPAESVYAVFEAKQTINAALVRYAQEKVASVRALHRTTLPVPFVEGAYKAKPLIPIYGGILTFESEWNPALGLALASALKCEASKKLDIGCIAAHGYFFAKSESTDYETHAGGKPATGFLFKLISILQSSGSVQMIDIQAYSKWLTE